MPSNRELKEQAEALGKELGVEVQTSGLANADLGKLVESLEAQRGEKTAPSGLGTPSPEPPGPVEVVNKPGPRPPSPPVRVARIDGADDGSLGGPPKPKGKRREPPTFPYYVAKGHSLVCAKGSIDQYEEIRVRDIGLASPEANAKHLAHLIERGIVVKTDP
jgi:hypothetical protein